jgi:hypothetical protein
MFLLMFLLMLHSVVHDKNHFNRSFVVAGFFAIFERVEKNIVNYP